MQGVNLPIELILEICRHLSVDEEDGPRDRAANAYLLGLMTASRLTRQVVRQIYWKEVKVASRSQASSRSCALVIACRTGLPADIDLSVRNSTAPILWRHTVEEIEGALQGQQAEERSESCPR